MSFEAIVNIPIYVKYRKKRALLPADDSGSSIIELLIHL
jgi:hypothetical protein